MSRKIQIKGLRGTIYQRGEDSYRVQLSLGRNAQGKYDVKRETIRGTEQDAIDLLTRWNVEYLDHTIMATNHQTVQQVYEQWIEFIKEYRTPNTYNFYRVRFNDDILPVIGHRRLRDVTLQELQRLLAKYPSKDRHNKRALSAFYGWCVKNKKLQENFCIHLETRSRPQEQTEDDVWNVRQVHRVYEYLTFENLYDIFIVLGIEFGLRPQEIMALTWDDITEEYIAIEEAIKDRTPEDFVLGSTKGGKSRYLILTPFAAEKLQLHKRMQHKRIENNARYNIEHNLVVADSNGHVPDLGYIRRYMATVATRAGVPRIPPKNLRTTHISLMNDFDIPLPEIQKQAGHSEGSRVTRRNYIRTYTESLRQAAMIFHQNLHENKDAAEADLPSFAH